MAIQMDPITHRKLAIVKQLYQHATLQSNQRGLVSRILAVVVFDLAIETGLKALASSVDPSKVPAEGFPGLVQQVKKHLGKNNLGALPDEANISHVHSIRNDTQHKAKYPNDIDVGDCRTYTRDFLQKIIRNVWDISFEEITLTDFVKHSRIKEFLVGSETAFGENDYQQAVNQAAAGLTWALLLLQEPIVGRLWESSKFIVEDRFKRVGVDEDASRTFRRVQETLLLVALGMDYASYIRYRSLAPVVVFAADKSVNFYGPNASRQFTQDEAEFAMAYCVDAVVQIEERVGDIDRPFEGEVESLYRLVM
jgi:hypothetical protein